MNDKILVQKLTKEFGKHESDTGSAAVQIAILTHDIERLKKHFRDNKKDLHSARGFIAKIEKRKKLISYLKNKNFNHYQEVIKALGIRK